jgi:hypothetical protein
MIKDTKANEYFGNGGDDSTFDYDPDHCYVIWQFGRALALGLPHLAKGLQQTYEDFITWAKVDTGLGEWVGSEVYLYSWESPVNPILKTNDEA